MWLAWEIAIVLAVALTVLGAVLRRVDHPRARDLSPFAFEAAVLFALYTLWRIAGRLSIMEADQAIERGRQLWDLQQTMGLPDEADLQAMILPHPWIVQFANIYYAVAHVPAMVLCLFWLFARHRDYYPPIRNALAASTAACLAIQLWPVAPPRFVVELGIVDTPDLYDQSVYSALGYQVAGQLQAMPSIHVAWAVLVAVAVWRAGGRVVGHTRERARRAHHVGGDGDGQPLLARRHRRCRSGVAGAAGRPLAAQPVPPAAGRPGLGPAAPTGVRGRRRGPGTSALVGPVEQLGSADHVVNPGTPGDFASPHHTI